MNTHREKDGPEHEAPKISRSAIDVYLNREKITDKVLGMGLMINYTSKPPEAVGIIRLPIQLGCEAEQTLTCFIEDIWISPEGHKDIFLTTRTTQDAYSFHRAAHEDSIKPYEIKEVETISKDQ